MSEKIENVNESAALSGITSTTLFGIWQPIETAPKDGTKILVYLWQKERHFGTDKIPAGHVVKVAQWLSIQSTKEEDAGNGLYRKVPITTFEGWNAEYFQFMPIQIQPTHWMPLPDMPNNGDVEHRPL